LQTSRKIPGEIQFGTLGADMEVSAAIIRDETTIMTEPYEKITLQRCGGRDRLQRAGDSAGL
jgi:hypothetical protein